MKQITPEWGKHFDLGFIGFSNRTSVLSKGITWFEGIEEQLAYGEELLGSGASHVFIVMTRVFGMEASKDGIAIFNLQKRIDDPNIKLVFREPEGMNDLYVGQLLDNAKALEGDRYDYGRLFGYVINILSPLHHIFPALKKLPVPVSTGGLFCSAFVVECMKNTDLFRGFPLFKEYHPTRISPNLLWNHGPWKPLKEGEKK